MTCSFICVATAKLQPMISVLLLDEPIRNYQIQVFLLSRIFRQQEVTCFLAGSPPPRLYNGEGVEGRGNYPPPSTTHLYNVGAGPMIRKVSLSSWVPTLLQRAHLGVFNKNYNTEVVVMRGLDILPRLLH
jgi:hypothetical protein